MTRKITVSTSGVARKVKPPASAATSAGVDSDAIHDNVSGEIAAITEKASPVGADLLLIEDSAASNAKKRVQITNLPGGADADAIHDNVAGEIAALTLVTAASGDHVLIEDASDSNNKKRVAASDFLSGGGGGSLVLLSESTLGSDAANIQLGSLATTGTDLLIVGKARCASAVTVAGMYLRVGNGTIDSGAGQYEYHFEYTGHGSSDVQSTGATSIQVGDMPGASSPADHFSLFRLMILDYADTSARRYMHWTANEYRSAGVSYGKVGSGFWNDTSSAIDVVQIFPGTGNLLAGSTLRIYSMG